MPIYSYIALKAGSEVVKGQITASNHKDARDVIRKMGLVPTKLTELTDNISSGKAGSVAKFSLSLNEKIDFVFCGLPWPLICSV